MLLAIALDVFLTLVMSDELERVFSKAINLIAKLIHNIDSNLEGMIGRADIEGSKSIVALNESVVVSICSKRRRGRCDKTVVSFPARRASSSEGLN
ncbi:hypothetical protein B0A54_17617 [Friedmanniomyces endolithicus]|uniref:Uncharacterized protein n=1 Tax=Friedmanniomyces endolithicus TaxID=329885 RepID=A0A4U0TQ35_9PEZI|nr:hypothetical protein B0A54_17617 [Friedmanniomyces endolithicus]